MLLRTLLLSSGVLTAPAAALALQLVLNPSFEENTASGSTYNMYNETATATIAHLTAFGSGEEIDLSTGNDFFGMPQDGDWFVTTHTRTAGDGIQDAFAMELTEALTIGALYRLAFFANSRQFLPGVEVGISTSATDFGVQVFSSTSYSDQASIWTELSTTFAADIAATHLTFRSGFPADSMASIDNISLDLVPEPSTATLLILGMFALAIRRRP